MAEPDEFIRIVTVRDSAPAVAPARGTDRGFEEIAARVADATLVSVAQVSSNLQSVMGSVSRMLQAIPDALSGYKVDEIEVSLEISSEGKVQLIGSLSAGVTGGITLKFKRQPSLGSVQPGTSA